MKQGLLIAGQSIARQKFHNSFRASDKSVCTSRISAFLNKDAFTISF